MSESRPSPPRGRPKLNLIAHPALRPTLEPPDHEARQTRRGLRADPNPETPWECRWRVKLGR